MARTVGTQVENNFIQGLVTERTALNFPENACTETYDCIFNHKGRVTRRTGWEYESGYSTFVTKRVNDAIMEYVWENVGGDGRKRFVVQQIGDFIYFYDIAYNTALSAGKHRQRINLSRYKGRRKARNLNYFACSFAQGQGYLFISHPLCDPIYVEYQPEKDKIKAHGITIEIRDFEGIHETAQRDEVRPTTLSAKHKYNLYNQGWDYDSEGTNVLSSWDSTFSHFPSNCDVWWHYKDSDESISGWTMVTKRDYGTTPAPKGHYILEAFNKRRDTASGLTRVKKYNTKSDMYRPNCVAFFAGRVFYGGVDWEDYHNKVYFSQIIENKSQFGKCYQRNDPTSEELSDLLPNDGGEVSVHEMGDLHHMAVVGTSL
ncbi:MAG: hypothetical protein ACWGQW_14030, partial [bacterium]